MAEQRLTKDASLTALIPLWARAMEGQTPNPLYIDDTAISLWEKNTYLKTKSSFITESDNITKKFTQIEIAIRTHIIDSILRENIDNYNSIVLNIGSGLCTRSKRIKGAMRFIESDSTLGLALRNKIFGVNRKEEQILIDLNNPIPTGYIREKTGNRPLTIVCEGTLMYFSKEKAMHLLNELAKLAGKGGRVVAEILGKKGAGLVHPMIKKINTELRYQWGMDSSDNLKVYNLNILSRHDVWKGYEKKWGPISHLVKWWPGGRYSLGSFILVIDGKDN